MTKYSIKLGELFGSAYYTYNVYTSSYNVKLDTTIIVTCQVRNIFGNPVANKELTPTYKGIAQETKQTNANGIAEWEIEVGTTGGTFKFAINNQYIFINVGGYKKIKEHSSLHYVLYVNEFTKTARLRFYFNGDSIASGNQYIVSNFVETEYCPKQNVIGVMTRSGNLLGTVLTNGEVSVTNTGVSTITPTFASQIEWSYD